MFDKCLFLFYSSPEFERGMIRPDVSGSEETAIAKGKKEVMGELFQMDFRRKIHSSWGRNKA
jgi:hypothetical protein